MLETMIVGVLRVAAALLLMMGVVVVLRGASAATRHAVWRAGFVIALVLPLMAMAFPWKLEVLPQRTAVPIVVGRSVSEAPQVGRGGPASTSWAPSATTAAAASSHERDAGTTTAMRASSDADLAQAEQPSSAGEVSWPAPLFAVWLAGALLLAGRLVVGHLAVRRIARRGRRLETSDWTSPLYEAADIIDVAVDVELVQSDRVTMPFTAGVRRPVIVMPASAQDWDLERRRAVLMHELAHVRRRDLIPHHVARWVCALHWFNPLAWMGARRMRAESERAADDLVLAAGTRASDYADHLLQIVSGAGRSLMPAPALPLAQRREFEGRMLAILEPRLRRRGPGRVESLAVTALVLVLTLPLAALEREGAPAVEDAGAAVEEADAGTSLEREAGEGAGMSERPMRESNRNHAREQNASRDANPPLLQTQAVDPNRPAAVSEPVVSIVPSPAVKALIRDLLGVALPVAGDAAAGAVEAVVPALIDAVSDVEGTVRQSVVEALGELGDPRSVQALIRVLRADTVDEVRASAAWALGEIEDPAAVEALAHALQNDVCEEVRKNAAWALGQIEDARAVGALGAALRDANAEVRSTAMWALGQIESPEAVPVLIPALRSADAEVREAAAWALGQIESPEAVTALLPLVSDAAPSVREAAVHALAQIEDPRAAPAMITVLGDANPDIRSMAAMALADMSLTTAPRALIAALTDSNPDVRMAAAHALGDIGDPAAADALTAALDDDDEDVRMAALHALLDLDTDIATDVLLRLLDHEDPNVRKHAAEVLGEEG